MDSTIETVRDRTSADIELLRETMRIAEVSREAGNHPFGALLAGPDGAVLIRSGNTFAADKGVGHAEMNVAREAALRFAPESSSAHARHIGRALPMAGRGLLGRHRPRRLRHDQERLAQLTGSNPEKLTIDMPCR